MSSELGDFTSSNRLCELVDILTENGKNNHRFENFSLLTTSKWIIAGGFPKERLRYYAYPAVKPVYLFIVEESDHKYPQVHVRTPSKGHDSELLEQSLRAILEKVKPLIAKHGKFLLECDTTARATFFKLLKEGAPFETESLSHVIPFYIDEEQERAIMKNEFTAPVGYEIGTLDPSQDYKFIHKMWPFAAFAPESGTRDRLEHLPSVCIKDNDGQIVSWEMTCTYGTLTHLFTLEEHRSKGLGALSENLLSQKLIKQGLHVYKYVVDTNEAVLRSTRKHPHWRQWKTLNDKNDNEEEIMWSFNHFKYTGK